MQRDVLTATVTNTSTYVITLPAQSSTDLFSLSAACSVLQNKPMLPRLRPLSSPNLSAHNYTEVSLPPSESLSLLFTPLLYPPRHLSIIIAIYIYLESIYRIAWWSPKSLFYPETQVLYSSCKAWCGQFKKLCDTFLRTLNTSLYRTLKDSSWVLWQR